MQEAKLFLGSQIVEKDQKTTRHNPYTKQPVSTAPVCDAEDALKALETAKNAARTAKSAPLHQRIDWMLDVSTTLLAERDHLARLITDEVAKPIDFARVEVERCAETIRLSAYAAAEMTGKTIPTDIMPSGRVATAFYRREPVGVVVAITPFNFPMNLVAHKIGPALVAGNAVVLKPTPEAPACGSALAEMFIQSRYAIPDALSVVYGDAEVGSALVSSSIPRVISFTGSVPVGKIITQTAGIKKTSLELGGNAATFIEQTADLAHAAKRCAVGAFSNSGQVCISLQRIYVEETVHDAFAELLRNESQQLVVGDPYESGVFMSALINEEAKMRAERWVESALSQGARKLCGGIGENDLFLPTVLADVTDSMEVVCEEAFAPIVSLVKVKNFDEAVEKMNDSPYGLQFSLFSNDLKLAQRAIDELECGGVVINDIPTLRFDVQPYGGVKLSGIGREGPAYAIEEFTEIKSVIMT